VRDFYLLRLTNSSGVSATTGPLPLTEAMQLVDAHALPHGWQHRYLPVTPLDETIAMLTTLPHTEPVLEQDLFVALRRAIICDREFDGLDDDRTLALLAHVDQHRPQQLFTGPEECLLGECAHPGPGWAHCPGIVPAEQICLVCSVIHDSNSEYGPQHLLRVPWPCSVIVAASVHYDIQAQAGDHHA
jgi:hypothetical protein